MINNNNNNKLIGILTARYPIYQLNEYIEREVLSRGLPKEVELASKMFMYKEIKHIEEAKRLEIEYKGLLEAFKDKLLSDNVKHDTKHYTSYKEIASLKEALSNIYKLQAGRDTFKRVDNWINYGILKYQLDMKTLSYKAGFTL